MPGESFDDFLISLRELAKTCRFCSEACTEKSTCDQVIEGLSDGDTIEDLLQVSDLTFDSTINKFQSRVAARKHRTDITAQGEAVAHQENHRHHILHHKLLAQAVGQINQHNGGRVQCPAYDQKCVLCQKIGHLARVCRSKRQINPPTPQTATNAIHVQSPQERHLQLYNVKDAETEVAPTIMVKVTSLASTKFIQMLPDSGADISAVGQELLHHLGHHVDNLLPSSISPRAVNGTTMIPLGKIPVTLQLGSQGSKDDLHIYPGVSGALISWKTGGSTASKLSTLNRNPGHGNYPTSKSHKTRPGRD